MRFGESKIDSTAVGSILRWIAPGPFRMEGGMIGMGRISVKGCIRGIGLVWDRGRRRSRSMLGCFFTVAIVIFVVKVRNLSTVIWKAL